MRPALKTAIGRLGWTKPDDVNLNQPGRAIARCVLWALIALPCWLYPLGWVCKLIARWHRANYVAENLANLFLSPVLITASVTIVGGISLIAFPLLGRSTVPRPPVTRDEG